MARTNNMQSDLVGSLKVDILSGRYTEGEYLPPPSALAERFCVGQSVVREGISALKAIGFVEVKRGRKGGVIVVDRSIEILTDRLMECMLRGEVVFAQTAKLRLLLEIDSCRAGTPTADESIVARLRALDERMLTTDNPDEQSKLNTEFHLTICSMAGNVLQGIFLRLLLEFVGRVALYLSRDYRFMHSPDEHAPIIQAIADKDAERACNFLRKHIENSNERVSKLEKEFFSRATKESILSGLRKAI